MTVINNTFRFFYIKVVFTLYLISRKEKHNITYRNILKIKPFELIYMHAINLKLSPKLLLILYYKNKKKWIFYI